MLASSANQEGQANHARKLYGIPYESEFNAAGIMWVELWRLARNEHEQKNRAVPEPVSTPSPPPNGTRSSRSGPRRSRLAANLGEGLRKGWTEQSTIRPGSMDLRWPSNLDHMTAHGIPPVRR